MTSRHTVVAAAHVLLVRDSQLLMLRRAGTGWCDGQWSVPAGHVEPRETVVAAAAREAAEETGLILDPARLRIAHVMHRAADDSGGERIDFFFTVSDWAGEPVNAEPGKCDRMGWADPGRLRSQVVPYVAAAVGAWLAGGLYSEFGWTRRTQPAAQTGDAR